MKQWYLIDHTQAEVCDIPLEMQTREGAIEEAVAEWEHLTDEEKAFRTEYYIARFDLDEDGFIDLDTEEDRIDIILFL